MRDLKELNLDTVGADADAARPSQDLIRQIEAIVGVRLPGTYLEFIQFCNGGRPELDTIVVQSDDDTEEEFSVNSFFSVMLDDQDARSVLWLRKHGRGIPAGHFAFADDGGGNIFTIDCNEESYGDIFIVINDYRESLLVRVAPSFEDFIDRLHMNSDYV